MSFRHFADCKRVTFAFILLILINENVKLRSKMPFFMQKMAPFSPLYI